MTGGEIIGYFKNGEFRAEPPTAGGLAGSRGRTPRRGSRGAEPLCFVIADFNLYNLYNLSIAIKYLPYLPIFPTAIFYPLKSISELR